MAAEKTTNTYRYRVVDVFTQHPLEGNPLAVFPHAAGLDDLTMQRIARELNLSETTFVVPSTRANCAIGVRIFTSTRELVFAGHPTIGTSFVALAEGLIPPQSDAFALDEKIGPVPIRIEPGERSLIWLTTPPIHFGQHVDRSLCAQALGLEPHRLLDIPPQLVSAGNPTVFIALQEKADVDRAWLDLAGMAALQASTQQESFCVFVFTPTTAGAYARMFAPAYGIVEDPATGSSTGPLAAFMMQHRLVSPAAGSRFISEQGTRMGRRSILHVHIHGEQGADAIDVGGYVTPIIEATMTL